MNVVTHVMNVVTHVVNVVTRDITDEFDKIDSFNFIHTLKNV